MTDHPTDSARSSGSPPERGGGAVLSRALSRARWSIFWERLWPALAGIATVIGLFLAVSWLGLWLWLPPIGRAIGLGAFFLLAAAAFAPLLLLRVPTVQDGLRRLDRNSGRLHRPATAIADEIAAPTEDAFATAIWRAHVLRALGAAKTLKAGVPVPRVASRDPYALRALVGVLVVATFFAAGNDRLKRIAAAFDWHGVITPSNFRIDAWVSPPTYTGKPPVILPGLRTGEPVPTMTAMSVPAGSTLVIRATGQVDLDVAATGGLEEPKDGAQKSLNGTVERRFVINDAGSASVRGVASSDVTWRFTAIPDKPPTIALAKDPEGQARGSLQLNYKLEDDYGVVGAQARFRLLRSEGTNGQPPRALFDAPEITLALPQARTRAGVGQTLKDLTEHPWAGTDVAMTLVARDEAANEGVSAPFEFRLPERPFSKPIARALVEQRRVLALDADAQAQVLTALDALTLAPERFNMETNVYLGMRSIFWQLARAKTDDQLRDVVARMWDMAVNLEDGNVSDAEQALRAAEEALRQALERGASDEEIKKLTDQLRAALDKFLQALAEQLRKNPQQLARPLDPNTRQVRPQDLRSMIDRLEQMARSGAKDAAKRLLQELQSMLENLQMARPGQQMDGGGDDDMMQALDELQDVIRKQQQLRDRTFQEGQDRRRDRQRGQQGEQGEQQMGELQQNQQALRDQLKKLMEELRKKGFGQNQQGQQGQQGQRGPGNQLGEAGEAMGQAEGQLGDGDADGAVGSQGRALEALRRGAQNLAQQMQQQGMMGMGMGPGQPGRLGQPRAQQETDPLGRPLRGRDYGDDTTVKVPGEIDVQRARRILEELRKRFGESFRPQLELDYIERLLRDF
ncbi:MAG: TIGR02302 family protein [Xanthobacteraceae bacterium]